MKAYITKYALTKGFGIKETDYSVPTGQVFKEKYLKTPNGMFELGKDICLTHEAAVQRAEEMRLSEIERLQKEINRLENLKF